MPGSLLFVPLLLSLVGVQNGARVFVAVAVGVGVNFSVAVAVGVCVAVNVGVKVIVGVLVFVGVNVFVTVGVSVPKNPPKLLSLASHANNASNKIMTMIVMITFGFIFTLHFQCTS